MSNRCFIGTESSSQFFEGRALDFCIEKIYKPYKKDIEDVLIGTSYGFFFWLDYPMHRRQFDAINSSMVGTPASMIPTYYPIKDGYKSLAITAATAWYNNTSFIYGIYVTPEKQERNPKYEDIQLLAKNKPTDSQISDYEKRNLVHINSLDAQKKAYIKRRSRKSTLLKEERLRTPLSDKKQAIVPSARPMTQIAYKEDSLKPEVVVPIGEQSSSDSLKIELEAARLAGAREVFIVKF